MAIRELAKNYSAATFRVEIGHCREVISKLVDEDNRSDQERARYRILRYLDLQLARSVGWVDKEADLMAWVMRNLIKLKFWAKFVSESGEKATQFLNESNIDLREVAERLEKSRPADAEPTPAAAEFRGKAYRREAVRRPGRVDLEERIEADTPEFLSEKRV